MQGELSTVVAYTKIRVLKQKDDVCEAVQAGIVEGSASFGVLLVLRNAWVLQETFNTLQIAQSDCNVESCELLAVFRFRVHSCRSSCVAAQREKFNAIYIHMDTKLIMLNGK